jgi:hypothetical protein
MKWWFNNLVNHAKWGLRHHLVRADRRYFLERYFHAGAAFINVDNL